MPTPFDQLVGDDAFGGPGQPGSRPTITRTPPRSTDRRRTVEGGFGSLFFPSQAQAQGEQRGAFQEEFLAQIKAGIPVQQAILDAALKVPGVLEDPSFPKTAQDIAKLFGPQAEPVVKKSEIPASMLEALPPRKQERFFGVAGPANVQLIDEIQASEKAGDTARTERLQRLLKRGANDRISVMDVLRLRLIGVQVDEALSFEGVNEITSAQAGTALRAGADERSATDNDLIQAAVAGDVTARQVIDVKTALKRQEMDAFMSFFASQSPEFAKFITEQNPTVQGVFEKIDKERERLGLGGGPQGPQKGVQVPIVGGKGGQAAGPQISVEQVLDETAMSEEDVRGLAGSFTADNPPSPEMATAITKRLGLKRE